MMSSCYKLKGFVLAVLLVSGIFLSLSSPLTASALEGSETGEISTENTPPTNQSEADSGKQVVFDTAGQFIYNSLTSIGALFASLGGKLLNISLSYFVFDMKGTIDYFGITSVIEDTWSLIRDLFNLLFIFGLIFIGFSIILEVNDSKAKSTLGTLIVAALLINFSLYASQIVVDFGNVMSGELSKKFEGASPANSTAFGMQMRDISSSFIAATDLTNLGSTTIQKANELAKGRVDLPNSKLGIGHALAIGLLIALMLIMIGFVLAAGAVIMFTRFLYLIFLMMFSPVMFLGAVLPKFQKVSSDWWNALLKQTFIGPVYLFMLLVSLRALEGLEAKQTGELGVTAFLLSVLLVCAFAWAALMAAQKFGAYGATYAINLGNDIGKMVKGRVANATVGAAGRNTLGRFGNWYNKKLEERGVSDKSIGRSIAASMAGAKYGGLYSQTSVKESADKAAQKAGRYAQIQAINTAISGSLAARDNPDERSKMERAIATASNEQIIELLGEHKKGSPEYDALVRNMTAGQFDAAMKAKPDELNDTAKRDLNDARTIATQDVLRKAAVDKALEKDKNSTLKADSPEAMQEGIKDAKDFQLKALGVDILAKNAAYLKQSQFEDIMKSKDYTPTEQERIKKAREKGLQERFNDDKEREKMFKGLQDKDIASLPKDILLDDNGRSVKFLTGGALRKIAEDDKLAEADREELRDTIRHRDGIDAKSSALNYLRSPQGQEKYGTWPE